MIESQGARCDSAFNFKPGSLNCRMGVIDTRHARFDPSIHRESRLVRCLVVIDTDTTGFHPDDSFALVLSLHGLANSARSLWRVFMTR